MFDPVPPNLPVEPTPPMPLAPPMPSATPIAPKPMSAMSAAPKAAMPSGKKEPEDIFSNMETGLDMAKPSALPPMQPLPPRASFQLKPVLIGLGALIVLGGGGFAVWAFVLNKPVAEPAVVVQQPPVAQQQQPQTPSNAQPQEQQPQPSPVVVETPPPEAVTPEVAPPVTTPPAGVNIPLPGAESPIPSSVVVPEGVDSDIDALTNAEEKLIGTDPLNPDTDGDGYLDGAEIKGLYSPLAKGVGINAVTTLKRVSIRGMSFLLPGTWTVGQSPGDPSSLIVDTGSLAFWKISARDTTASEASAYVDSLRAQTGASPLSTKSGIQGALDASGLRLSFAIDGTIVNVDYETNGASAVEYRTLFALLFQSLEKVAR